MSPERLGYGGVTDGNRFILDLTTARSVLPGALRWRAEMLSFDEDPLPEISHADYLAFYKRISDLPESYGSWLMISDDEARLRWKNSQTVRMIRLTPAEFDLYWRAQGSARLPTIYDLWCCAADKARGYGPTQTIDVVDHCLEC